MTRQDKLIEKQDEFIEFIKTQSIDSPFRADELKYKRLLKQIAALRQEQDNVPSNQELEREAKEYAVHHSSAPDKETPDWIITDWLAGANYVRFKYLGVVNYDKKESENKTLSRKEKVFDFVVRHKTDFYRAFKISIDHEGFKTSEGSHLVDLARKEIGYSVKTWDGDIYYVLYRVYRSIAIDGVNSPTEIKQESEPEGKIAEEIINKYCKNKRGHWIGITKEGVLKAMEGYRKLPLHPR